MVDHRLPSHSYAIACCTHVSVTADTPPRGTAGFA